MHYSPGLNTGKNVFVFGSNLAGRHGKGAALDAKLHWGAIQGVGQGAQGQGAQGQAYAIPTKDAYLKVLPLIVIQDHVSAFLYYTKDHPELTFLVTRIGCGLAGYKDEQIAPMFFGAPDNCVFPDEWKTLR